MSAAVMLDVDGVLLSFMRAYTRALGGREFSEDDCPVWGPPAGLGEISDRERRQAMARAHSREGILDIGLLSGAREGVRAIQDAGHRVVIVTRRASRLGAETQAALAELGVVTDGLIAGASLDKLCVCRELGLGIVIDDKPAMLRQARDAGLLAASIRWPYHRDVEGEAGILLASGWHSLVPALLDAAQGAAAAA